MKGGDVRLSAAVVEKKRTLLTIHAGTIYLRYYRHWYQRAACKEGGRCEPLHRQPAYYANTLEGRGKLL